MYMTIIIISKLSTLTSDVDIKKGFTNITISVSRLSFTIIVSFQL